MKNIPSDWLDKPGFLNFNIYDRIIENLNLAGKISKIPKYTYSIPLDKCYAEKSKVFWGNSFEDNELDNEDWEEIHLRNFKCTMESRLRSFYFKIFHRAISFRDFLFIIKRIDSPECWFCQNVPETINHIFCECDVVKPLWLEIDNTFHLNTEFDCQLSNFEKSFWDVFDNKFLTYIILCTKYFIYRCKFQDKKPHVNGLKSFIKSQREIEYCIAKKKGKLSLHFKKWSFVI